LWKKIFFTKFFQKTFLFFKKFFKILKKILKNLSKKHFSRRFFTKITKNFHFLPFFSLALIEFFNKNWKTTSLFDEFLSLLMTSRRIFFCEAKNVFSSSKTLKIYNFGCSQYGPRVPDVKAQNGLHLRVELVFKYRGVCAITGNVFLTQLSSKIFFFVEKIFFLTKKIFFRQKFFIFEIFFAKKFFFSTFF
jgi:hypothetical protein